MGGTISWKKTVGIGGGVSPLNSHEDGESPSEKKKKKNIVQLSNQKLRHLFGAQVSFRRIEVVTRDTQFEPWNFIYIYMIYQKKIDMFPRSYLFPNHDFGYPCWISQVHVKLLSYRFRPLVHPPNLGTQPPKFHFPGKLASQNKGRNQPLQSSFSWVLETLLIFWKARYVYTEKFGICGTNKSHPTVHNRSLFSLLTRSR